MFRGYDPKKVINQEIELLHDFQPFEASQTDAEKFKYEHGDKSDIWACEGGQVIAVLLRCKPLRSPATRCFPAKPRSCSWVSFDDG